ncbi:MAG: ferritin-like domain-containing protein [Acidimicrobiia bacterium]
MTSEGYHEPVELLSERTMDHHRAIVSLMEELEAVDWYDQRVEATNDPELAAILAHNRDEEKEHAAMTLEWLRRRDPVLDDELRTYLFTDGDILEAEAEAMGRNGDGTSPDAPSAPRGLNGSLGIGSLKGEEL